jgi:hypothetical protein
VYLRRGCVPRPVWARPRISARTFVRTFVSVDRLELGALGRTSLFDINRPSRGTSRMVAGSMTVTSCRGASDHRTKPNDTGPLKAGIIDPQFSVAAVHMGKAGYSLMIGITDREIARGARKSSSPGSWTGVILPLGAATPISTRRGPGSKPASRDFGAPPSALSSEHRKLGLPAAQPAVPQ